MDVNHGPLPVQASELSAQIAHFLGNELAGTFSVSSCVEPEPPRWVGARQLRQIEPTCRFDLSIRWSSAGEATACLEVSLMLADAMIDLAMGSQPHPLDHQRHSLTAVDRYLLQPALWRVLAGINQAVAAAGASLEWANGGAAEPAAERSDAQYLDLPFRVWLGECCGVLRLLLPAGPPWLSSPQEGTYAASETASTAGAEGAPVTILAVIEESGYLPTELDALEAGDLLATDLPAAGEIIVTADGKPRFAAQLGQYNGHRAVTITRKL